MTDGVWGVGREWGLATQLPLDREQAVRPKVWTAAKVNGSPFYPPQGSWIQRSSACSMKLNTPMSFMHISHPEAPKPMKVLVWAP